MRARKRLDVLTAQLEAVKQAGFEMISVQWALDIARGKEPAPMKVSAYDGPAVTSAGLPDPLTGCLPVTPVTGGGDVPGHRP